MVSRERRRGYQSEVEVKNKEGSANNSNKKREATLDKEKKDAACVLALSREVEVPCRKSQKNEDSDNQCLNTDVVMIDFGF